MKLIFYSIIFNLISIQTFIGQDVIQIDPERISCGTLTLSDLIESIEYIPLETNNDCLIGDIGKNNSVILSNNYILIQCSTTQLFYLFNRAGKLVKKIGNIGNGPGEYLRYGAVPFAIDEENQRIILRNNGAESKLIFYDLRGKYLRSVSVDEKLGAVFHAQFDDRFVMMHLNNPFKAGIPPFNYSIFSDDYKLITEKIKKADYTIRPRSSNQFTVTKEEGFSYYLYNGLLHVKGALNDSLYSISRNLSFLPKYIINPGKYSFTRQILSDPALFDRVFQYRVYLTSIFETDGYVLISYRYQNKDYYHCYDKRLHSSMLFNSASGIPNDYDGGLDFWPNQQNGNEFITWYQAYLFEENDNRIKPKGSKNAVEYFKKLRKDMESDANPVLVIAKMKQNI
ncbi:MAG: 6-bladed beta-propeller [Tannerella sp.]|jgi:hypothetical protein|nr:6-bladed beta-propeller [Tannerella sp.]